MCDWSTDAGGDGGEVRGGGELVRAVKERRGEVLGGSGDAPVLTLLEIAADNRHELRIVDEAAALSATHSLSGPFRPLNADQGRQRNGRPEEG